MREKTKKLPKGDKHHRRKRPLGKPKYLANVQSKIKSKVEADRRRFNANAKAKKTYVKGAATILKEDRKSRMVYGGGGIEGKLNPESDKELSLEDSFKAVIQIDKAEFGHSKKKVVKKPLRASQVSPLLETSTRKPIDIANEFVASSLMDVFAEKSAFDGHDTSMPHKQRQHGRSDVLQPASLDLKHSVNNGGEEGTDTRFQGQETAVGYSFGLMAMQDSGSRNDIAASSGYPDVGSHEAVHDEPVQFRITRAGAPEDENEGNNVPGTEEGTEFLSDGAHKSVVDQGTLDQDVNYENYDEDEPPQPIGRDDARNNKHLDIHSHQAVLDEDYKNENHQPELKLTESGDRSDPVPHNTEDHHAEQNVAVVDDGKHEGMVYPSDEAPLPPAQGTPRTLRSEKPQETENLSDSGKSLGVISDEDPPSSRGLSDQDSELLRRVKEDLSGIEQLLADIGRDTEKLMSPSSHHARIEDSSAPAAEASDDTPKRGGLLAYLQSDASDPDLDDS